MTKYDERTKKDAKYTRREHLNHVGGFAFGIGAFGMDISSISSNEDITKIVTLRNSEGPVKTEEVSTKWYNREKAAKRGSEILKGRLLDKEDIVVVGQTLSDEFVGGKRVHNVKVGIKGSTTDVDIPEEINNVPVEILKNVSITPRCYQFDYTITPGGAAVLGYVKTNSEGVRVYGGGSACCAVYKGGNEYLLTARHLFIDGGYDCNLSALNKELLQYEQFFGDVSFEDDSYDMAIIPPDPSRDVDNDIVNENSDIFGWVTEAGLATYSSDGTPMCARGQTTCTWTDTIDSYNDSYSTSSCFMIDNVTYTNAKSAGGDSGGIYYFESNNDNAFVTNMLSGTVGGQDFGPAAYAINDTHGYTFGN